MSRQRKEFDSLQDWESGHYYAHLKPNAAFWKMDHMNLREMPRNSVNECMMVEKMWDWMGPQEHVWFSRFMPDVRERYPLETEHVNPWNVEMATRHYGCEPVFNNAAIASIALQKHPVPLETVLPSWLEQRRQRGMAIDCWQLTAEMIVAYHTRDHMGITRQNVYHSNVDDRAMKTLQTLCPSPDWPMALACAGIASDDLYTKLKEGTLDERGHQAVAWLQWWLHKSPHCLDNMAWTWVMKEVDFVPDVEPTTALLLDLCQGAKDPRDTFFLARQTYGDMRQKSEPGIDSAAFQTVLEM